MALLPTNQPHKRLNGFLLHCVSESTIDKKEKFECRLRRPPCQVVKGCLMKLCTLKELPLCGLVTLCEKKRNETHQATFIDDKFGHGGAAKAIHTHLEMSIVWGYNQYEGTDQRDNVGEQSFNRNLRNDYTPISVLSTHVALGEGRNQMKSYQHHFCKP